MNPSYMVACYFYGFLLVILTRVSLLFYCYITLEALYR